MNKFYKLVEIESEKVGEHKGAFVMVTDNPLTMNVNHAINKVDFALHICEGAAFMCNLESLIKENLKQKWLDKSGNKV